MTLHYRKDRPDQITGINPNKTECVVDHITKARGKKTQYTSVSDDASKLDRFDGVIWGCEKTIIVNAGHTFIDHADVIQLIRASNQPKRKRLQAIRNAQRARECLIDWLAIVIPQSLNSGQTINFIELYLTREFFWRV